MILNWILGNIAYLIGKLLIFFDVLNLKNDLNLIKLSKKNLKSDIIIPIKFNELIILAEDKRFYFHFGFDIHGIFRAFIHNVFFKKFEGASTITQQLVRTITQAKEPSIKRKVKEIILATQLKKIYIKKEIITHYLLIAYYGTNLNGLKDVVKKYNKNIENLNETEIAEIIARLKYPEPSNGKNKKIILRRNYILNKYNQTLTKGEKMTKIKKIIFTLFLAIFLLNCTTISPFNETAYQQATSIKATALLLMNHATEDVSAYSKEIDSITLDMEKSYEYAKARPQNEESTKQWEIIKDPNKDLLGGFLKMWKDKGHLSQYFITEKKKQIGDSFDSISKLEIKKIKK